MVAAAAIGAATEEAYCAAVFITLQEAAETVQSKASGADAVAARGVAAVGKRKEERNLRMYSSANYGLYANSLLI